jgi:uncharacterized protein (TIGR03435 family)
MVVGVLLMGACEQRGIAQSVVAASPAFEASTVKVNKTGRSGYDTDFNDERFTGTNVSLKNVMEEAFGITEARIEGGPKWVESERFDIEAKMDEATAAQIQKLGRKEREAAEMKVFQQLLAQRFKLAFHWESHEMPVYALVTTKKGPLLHEAAKPQGGGASAHNGELKAEGVTMDDLADILTQDLARELGREVVNRTGVQGRYDLELKWTASREARRATDNGERADEPPSIFTATQEQLGLKLESAKGPVQVLVIDHVEMPTEN